MSSRPISDLPAIWGKVLNGDTVAWGKLVDSYAVLVYSVVVRAGLNEADAEDCAQDVWLALYRKRNSIRDPKAIPAWLIRTARRRANEIVRRLRHAGITAAEQAQVNAAPADHEIITSEDQTILARALRQLDPRCRMLLEILYSEGEKISYSRLARQLGLSPNSLGPLRSRCLSKLKKILEKMNFSMD